MSNSFILARQPILDSTYNTLGYELFYRGDDITSEGQNLRYATSSVLVQVLNKIGLDAMIADTLAFINVEETFLKHDMILSIPSERFVFELSNVKTLNTNFVNTVFQLTQKGYRFCIEDEEATIDNLERYLPLLPYVSYYKINTLNSDEQFIVELIEYLNDYDCEIIAYKVESKESQQRYLELGVKLFQGYYFAEPEIIEDKKLSVEQTALFELCSLLQSGCSIDDLEVAFEKNQSITIQLLQYINSGAFHFRNKISSIKQIITLMGRNTLINWLMLLLYSKSVSKDEPVADSVMLLVLQRTELMHAIIEQVDGNDRVLQANGYFVSILSLIETILHVPLIEIAKKINIDDAIIDALKEHNGHLGELLQLIQAIEQYDLKKIKAFEAKYDLDSRGLMQKIESSLEASMQKVPN